MPAREIPGFYFDESKNKYFRIQPNHLVAGGPQAAQARHSHDAVRKRKREQTYYERIKTRETAAAVPGSVRRAPILTDIVPGFLACRELGVGGAGRRGSGRTTTRTTLPAERSAALWRRSRLGCTGGEEISSFVRDPKRGGLFVGIGIHEMGKCNIMAYSPVSDYRPWAYSFAGRWNYAGCGGSLGAVTSFSLSPTDHLLSTACSIGGECAQTTISQVVDFSLDDNPQLVGGISTTFSFARSLIFSSAACPDTASARFAIGESSRLLICNSCQYRWDIHVALDFCRHDVTAVEWLNPKTVMAGLNNSAVAFCDTRIDRSAMRLQTPHAVTKLLKLDDCRVIVGGRDSNLHMYDIRYAGGRVQHNPQPTKRTHTWTKPYLSFDDYSNREVIYRDTIDICPELGLLAAATDLNTISLFSLTTGRPIHTPCPEPPTRSARWPRPAFSGDSNELDRVTTYKYRDPITCLRFDPSSMAGSGWEHYAAAPPSLLVSSGNVIEDWVM